MNNCDLFTVVVPTMWKCPDIFETMLNRIVKHPMIHQIIIFDNDPAKQPSWDIFSSNKILLTKLGNENKNYYVNPCWNKGVELSETNRICIWSDDVDFDSWLFDKIYDELTPDKGAFGLITGEEKFGHPVLTDGSIEFKKWNWNDNPEPGNWGDNIHGFGQLMFVRKENWTPIVDGLDIYFGDDFIFHSHLNQGLNNYLIVNIRWNSPMACTSAIQEIVGGFYDREKHVYSDWSLENPVPLPQLHKPKKKILLGIPTNKYIETETFKSIYDLKIPDGYEIEFQTFYGYQIDQIRNLIADWARHYDYLLSVDSDIVLPNDALEKMLTADKDIVSGLYIQRIENTHTLEVYKDTANGGMTNIDMNEIDFSHQLQEIAGCGFGCVLIKGDVFRKMSYPHFVYKSALNHNDTVSEDTYFCMKARDYGFKAYMDTTIQCEHIGTKKFIV